jgi:hypothetical protein
MLSVLVSDNPGWSDVGQPIQAADPLSSRSSRLKAGCGQDCPPHRAAEPQPKNVPEARRAKENSPGREPWVRIADLPAPARGERSARLKFFRPVPGLACLSRRSQCSRTGLLSDAPPGLGLRQNHRALRRNWKRCNTEQRSRNQTIGGRVIASESATRGSRAVQGDCPTGREFSQRETGH